MPEAPISLRDAIVALAALDPKERQLHRDLVLELLNLPRVSLETTATSTTGTAPQVPPVAPPVPRPTATPPVTAPPAAEEPKPATTPAPSKLDKLDASTPLRPAWMGSGESKPLASAREASGNPSLPTLFTALETRGICGAALATHVAEGELDVPRVVDGLARLRSLSAIPRSNVRTLRRGMQLLLDRGANMEPYAGDVEVLERALSQVMGGSLIERAEFSYCPGRGVRSSATSQRRSWRPPPRGMPLLVVSDFGVSGSPLDEQTASVDEWQLFAREVANEGHTLIGVTPFGRLRWPTRLQPLVLFVHWCERTTAAAVDRSVREQGRSTA